MRKLLCLLMVVLIAVIPTFANMETEQEIAERQEEYERKLQYKKSDADTFMDTLDDVMREELVRSILSERDEELLAKMLYGEDRENKTYMRAAVIWCVFNRMDANNTPVSEMINVTQFPGYSEWNPVEKWALDIIWDVTIRYVLELNGFENVGRVLPKEYRYYEHGVGRRYHWFKTTLSSYDPNCVIWDWSLPSPYED